MKKFFSSTWFKCISVLLVISLIAGGLLAILNDVLYVTSEERTMRAIKKIYGEEKQYSKLLDVDDGDEALSCEDYGVIEKIFTVGDVSSDNYDLLFRSTGNHGYKNGTITLWIQVNFSSGVSKIEKVILESFTKQTLMSKLGSEYYSGFAGDTDDYFTTDEKDADKNYAPVSGATKSATAAVNAVNCVIYYLTEVA
ncbi:MAG: hypothetical protein SPL13_00430 [Clostridia bacterium]|nr:hypothetical protein [Clostridia bacterium]